MDQTVAALIGAGIAAFSGLAGALTTAFLGGWRQERLETSKRNWAIEDAASKKLDETINQLTLKLASAIHSMVWIAWIACEAPDRLTEENAAAYDKEMHAVLPEVMGISSQIASLNVEAYSMARSVVEACFRMDVRIGRACLEIANARGKAAENLVRLYPELVDWERGLPVQMAKIATQTALQRPERLHL